MTISILRTESPSLWFHCSGFLTFYFVTVWARVQRFSVPGLSHLGPDLALDLAMPMRRCPPGFFGVLRERFVPFEPVE
jgi:hypothetical protein